MLRKCSSLIQRQSETNDGFDFDANCLLAVENFQMVLHQLCRCARQQQKKRSFPTVLSHTIELYF